ncbi:MAG: TetR/AcrR family transcriptional regulator [Pseudomonadota bacterium]
MTNVLIDESDAQEPSTDGRRRRGQANRDAIVDAMMSLVEAGEVTPSAAKVAELAGVGLRTVYRHFDDLDSLYQEMSAIVRRDLEPILADEFEGPDVHARLDLLIRRRVAVYERVMPLKIAGNIRRFSSAFIMSDYEDQLRMEEDGLRSALAIVDDISEELFESLRVVTSFQCWRGLRLDHGLTVEDATKVMRRLVRSLSADLSS